MGIALVSWNILGLHALLEKIQTSGIVHLKNNPRFNSDISCLGVYKLFMSQSAIF